MSKKSRDTVYFRSIPQRTSAGRSPPTFNREARSVGVVASTEDPVMMWDWEHGEIAEVLLMKGAQLPDLGQIPLLDTHSRSSTSDVIGSARELTVDGTELRAVAVFSSTDRGQDALTKIEEGHLTDVSIGYRINDYATVKKGEKAVIAGRTWVGPVRVVTSWMPRELSVCPIGADASAKMRAAQDDPLKTQGEDEMNLDEVTRSLETTNQAVAKLAETVAAILPAVQAVTRQAVEDQRITESEKTVDEMRRAAVAAPERVQREERARIAEIDAMHEAMSRSTGIDFTAVRSECIEKGLSVAESRKMYMNRIATAQPTDRLDGIRVLVTADERDKSREAAVEGVQLRASIAVDKIKDPQGNEFAHMTMYELAKQRLYTFNHSVRGLSKMEVFKRALSTSDFANILADAANKALSEGFELAEETYPLWVDTTGRLNDYKPHQFSRASEAPAFSQVNPDGGEYKYGAMDDTKETVTGVDYGVIVPFTRKAMINDDLGALSDVKTKLGREAAATWGDLCYAVLTGNPAMGDGITLFHASSHGANLVTGGAIPSVTTLNAGAKVMATQTGLLGSRALNIRPVFLLAGYTQKGTVDQLVAQTTPVAVGTLSSPTSNPWAYLTPIYDARLDANALGVPWFLAARKGMTIKLFTLDGNMVPSLETKEGWNVDGMEFKARISGTAAAVDYAGLFQNDGA